MRLQGIVIDDYIRELWSIEGITPSKEMSFLRARKPGQLLELIPD